MEFAANTNRIEAGINASRFSAMVEAVQTRLHRYSAYRRTLEELNTLDDREICDLGLSRAMFRDLAREASRNI